MNRHEQEPPQEWSSSARWDTTRLERLPPPLPPSQVIEPPARPLWRPVRTEQDVTALVNTRHPAVIRKLIDTLGHRNFRVAWKAAEGLREFGDAGFRALNDTVLTCRGRLQERAVIALGHWGDMRATPALLRAVDIEQKRRNDGSILVAIVGALCMPPLLLWFLTGSARSTLLRVRVAEALANIGDLRAVGWLTQFAFSGSAELSVAGQMALDKMLPKFEAINHDPMLMIASDTVPGLAHLLSHSNLKLVRYALNALRFVGDGRALPAVERLAQMRSPYHTMERVAFASLERRLAEERNELAEMAHNLVPILRERARQAENHYTLLRGASAPTANPEELLRPAQGYGGPDDKPEELLRPSSS